MNRARRFTFGSVAVACAALVVSSSAILPAAADPPTEWVDAGTMTLTTGAATGADKVVYGDVTQALASTSSTNCDLATSGALLSFSGKAGSVNKPAGFLNDSIGVNERLRELCYKVDTLSTTGAETLELRLNPNLKNFAGRRLLATAVSLDMEVRSYLGAKARIQATAWLDSAQACPGTATTCPAFELVQGSTSGPTACPVVKDNDNCRLNFSPGARFNRLLLKVVKGSFSLEGGSDTQTAPPAIGPSTFTLASEVDTVFNCTDEDQSLTEGNVTVTFAGIAGTDPCEPFGVTLTAGDREVGFRKPLDVSPDAQFIFDIGWRLAPSGNPAFTLPQPEIDFEELPTPPEIFHPMPFCPASLYNSSGELVGVQDNDPSDLPDWVDDEILDGTQYACVGAPRSADVGPASVTVHDKIFLIGDAKMRM